MTALIAFTRHLVVELRSLATKLEHVQTLDPAWLVGELADRIESAAKKAFHL